MEILVKRDSKFKKPINCNGIHKNRKAFSKLEYNTKSFARVNQIKCMKLMSEAKTLTAIKKEGKNYPIYYIFVPWLKLFSENIDSEFLTVNLLATRLQLQKIIMLLSFIF